MIDSIQSEFLRYRRLIELALTQVSDEAFYDAPDDVTNSIAVVVKHIGGNLSSRFTCFLTEDGEKPWRHRDQEFEVPLPEDRAAARRAAMESLAEGWTALDGALADVRAKDALGLDVTIRGISLSVPSALLRSLAHVAYHAGQVVQLARSAAGSEWETLSVPKGGSAAYASNPTKERSPDGR